MYKAIFFLPLCFAVSLMVSPAAFAEEDVLQPPEQVQNTEGASERADLSRELAPTDIEGAEVSSYIRKDGTKITEYAVKGRVYMVRVQPAGKLPAYYLYDNNGDGIFEQRLPGGYKRPSPPMWVIKKF